MWERIRGYELGGFSVTGVAPHSKTQRYSFEIPADTHALLKHCYIFVQRATAPTTSGETKIEVAVLPVAGTERVIARQRFNSATAGTAVGTTFSESVYLRAGDVIRVYTTDASTGGTCDYLATLQIVLWR